MQYIDVIFALMSQIINYLSNVKTVKVKDAILDNIACYWKRETTLEIVEDGIAEAEVGGNCMVRLLDAGRNVSIFVD